MNFSVSRTSLSLNNNYDVSGTITSNKLLLGGVKTSNYILDISSNTSSAVKIGSNTLLVDTSNNTINVNNKLIVGDTNTLFVDGSNNKIGINTSTPQYNLHVSGDALVTGNFFVRGEATTICSSQVKITDPMVMFGLDNSQNLSPIGFYGQYTSSGTKYTGVVKPPSNNNYVLFTNESAVSETTGVTTASAGMLATSIGVGTGMNNTSLVDTIDVSGSLALTNTLKVGNTIATATSGSIGQILVSQGSSLAPRWASSSDISAQNSLLVDISNTTTSSSVNYITFVSDFSGYQKIQTDNT